MTAQTMLELFLVAASFFAGSVFQLRACTKRLLSLDGAPLKVWYRGKVHELVVVPDETLKGLKAIAGAIAEHLRVEDQLVTAHIDKLEESHVRALTRSIANVAEKFEEAGLAKRNRP